MKHNFQPVIQMKSVIIRRSLIVLIFLTPLFADLGCKKQPKCGCGKDVIFTLIDEPSNVVYTVDPKYAIFYPEIGLGGATYNFCSPGKWIDTLVLKNYASGTKLLVSGKAYYDCQYLMNAGNYGGYMPPAYQVEVTDLQPDNYSKK
jgi:hypothetical protein